MVIKELSIEEMTVTVESYIKLRTGVSVIINRTQFLQDATKYNAFMLLNEAYSAAIMWFKNQEENDANKERSNSEFEQGNLQQTNSERAN